MKIVISTIVLFMVCAGNLAAQRTIRFGYDDAGNRVRRAPQGLLQKKEDKDVKDNIAGIPEHSDTANTKEFPEDLAVQVDGSLVEVAKETASSVGDQLFSDLNDEFVSLFPNPTLSQVNLLLKGQDFSKKIAVQISDLNGKTFYSEQVMESHTIVDVSSWPAGVYVLRVSINNEPKQYRLVKQ